MRRHRAEKLRRLLHRHLQHFVDVFALVLDLQRFAVVALPVAHIAGHVDVRQKMHFHLEHAVALAGFAAPAFDIERKASRAIAAFARRRHAGEQVADRGEEPGVGRRIGARRAPDRALIDVHHLVEKLQPVDRFVRRRFGRAAVQMLRGGVVQRVVDQRRFARAGDAGHADEQPDRQAHGRRFSDYCRCAPVHDELRFGFGRWRSAGTVDAAAPDRYWPVSDSRLRRDLAAACLAQ